ncbi:MAG: rubrerythrin [Candidatus Muiribacterium halophilum]|uniref:Rubrerythrin n=1 Tax=Muiribacterium halophilum TaxID=2053465 RepID=A0A2N5ZFN5_MUIH1|nr:MAG: rubrerythrin [Candidatus Muirbacterium halophilum]
MKYNAYEIIEMAKKIEDNGSAFYRMAAEKTTESKAKTLFEDLANMEDVHKMVFEDFKSYFSDEEWTNMNFDSDNQMFTYLKEMADTVVFNLKNAERDLNEINTIDDIFRYAIEKEKESVLFYLGIKEIVPEKLGKDKVADIISEEMKHIAVLSDAWKNY